MLDLLRKKAQSPYLQATVIIIVLVFVFWGVGSYQGSQSAGVATVDDVTISVDTFKRAYDRAVGQVRAQFGGNPPPGIMDSLNLEEQVLDSLIQRVLIEKGAENVGLLVPDIEVSKAIQDMDAFKSGGVFDLRRYREVLAASRTTDKDFEQSMRSDLLVGKVREHIGRFARVAEAELQNRFAFDNDQRKLLYLSFAADDFKEKVEVTDDALAAFFEERKEQYKTKPQVKLQYALFLNDDLAAGLEIPESEVEKYYQEHIESYKTPEQRKARHILLRVRELDTEERRAEKLALAEEVLAKLKDGKDFAMLATRYSDDNSAAQGGDLGFFARDRMVKPFADAAFSLEVGAISGIVETDFGYHIVKVDEIKPANTKSLAEVTDSIRETLGKEQAQELARKLARESYEQILLAGSLEKYAASGAIAMQETDFFERSAPPKELAGKGNLLKNAFSLKKGELSSLIQDRAGFAIIHVADIKEPVVPVLADVRSKVEEDFIAERAKEMAMETAEAMLAEVTGGGDFAAAAASRQTVVAETELYSRSKPSSKGVPVSVLTAGFDLSADSPYPAKVEAEGGTFYVFRLQETQPVAEVDFADKRDELQEKLLTERVDSLLQAWLANLRSTTETTINPQFF